MQEDSNQSMLSNVETGLNSIEKLIPILRSIIGVVIPDFHACASGFEEICKKLLDANENLVRWINNFRDFDLTAPDAVEEFRRLTGNYRELKTGKQYQVLKFDCSEIETIYHFKIAGRLGNIFAGKKLEETKKVFERLTQADAELVSFIHNEIFEQLDSVCNSMEIAIDQGNLDAAEIARLQFKLTSNDMMKRLQEIGSGLTELVLDFRKVSSGNIL